MITADEQEIRRAVGLLVEPGAVTEVRALDAQTPAMRYPGTVTGYFDDLDSLVQAVRTLKSAKGVYVTPNPVDPALLARCKNRLQQAEKGSATQDSHIQRRRWLMIDLDPERPSGISSSDAEHEAALQRARDVFAFLRERGWPDPIAADSGNGAHLLYRIDLPTDDQGVVQRCLTALSRRFSDATVRIDEKVFNPARIWKLYGTTSRKGDDTPERPHRLTRILSAPDVLVPVSCAQLEALAGEVPSVEPPVHDDGNNVSRNGHFDVLAFIARHQLDVSEPEAWHGNQGTGTRWVFRKSPLCEHEDGAAYVVQHASGAITAGCHHDHCRWGWKDLRARLEPPTSHSASTTAGKARVKTEPATPACQPWIPFPVEHLPIALQEFTSVAARALECDPSFVALPLLATAAGCIGNSRVVRVKHSWVEPAILWAVCIGESGDGKTPAQSAVTRALWARESQAIQEHQQALEDYDRLKLLHQASEADWKKKGRKTGEPPPDAPLAPSCRRLLCDCTTIEALAVLLSQNPRGLLLTSDELAGWLGGHNEYKGKKGSDTANWLRMWQANSLLIDRKTSEQRTIHIPKAAVSIIGGIQPAILRLALGREHFVDGLAARLLVAMPPRISRTWNDTAISPAMQKQLGSLFEGLLSLQPQLTHKNEIEPFALTLDGDAKSTWTRWYNRHEEERTLLTGDLAAASAKLSSYGLRLALVVHLVRAASGEPVDHAVIDQASMESGIGLADWFGGEVHRVYAALSESDEQREQRELADLIRRKGHGRATPRDLMQWKLRYRRSADEAEESLEALAKAGLGRWEIVPSATKQARVFVLHEPTCGNRFVDSTSEFTNPELLPQEESRESTSSGDEEWVEV